MGFIDVFKGKKKEKGMEMPPPPVEPEMPALPQLEPVAPGEQIPPVEMKPERVMPSPKPIVSEPVYEEPPRVMGETVFVKIDDYREVLSGMQVIKGELKEAESVVTRLNEIKDEKDKQFQKWRTSLEDVQQKLAYVDNVLFE